MTKPLPTARPPLPYSSRHYLVTAAETRFFQCLRTAVGGRFLIAPKVRLADVIHCSARDWKAGFGGSISQKHVDFVLVSPGTLRILLCIELDDRSHERRARKARDAFLEEALLAAHVPLLRIRAAASYEPSRIRFAVSKAMASLPGRLSTRRLLRTSALPPRPPRFR